MPTYEYICPNCQLAFNAIRRISDRNHLAECTNCGNSNAERRRVTLFGLIKFGRRREIEPAPQKPNGGIYSGCSAINCKVGMQIENSKVEIDNWASVNCDRSIVSKNSEVVATKIKIE